MVIFDGNVNHQFLSSMAIFMSNYDQRCDLQNNIEIRYCLTSNKGTIQDHNSSVDHRYLCTQPVTWLLNDFTILQMLKIISSKSKTGRMALKKILSLIRKIQFLDFMRLLCFNKKTKNENGSKWWNASTTFQLVNWPSLRWFIALVAIRKQLFF